MRIFRPPYRLDLKAPKTRLALQRYGCASFAAVLLAAGCAPTTADAWTLDCPMRNRPFSVDLSLLDVMHSDTARATLVRIAPTLLTGLPSRLLSTTPPTQANVLTPRALFTLKRMSPEALRPLDRALRAIPVTLADRVARCERYDNRPLSIPSDLRRPRLLLFEKITGFRDGPSVDAARKALFEITARLGWSLVVTDRGGAMAPATLRQFDAVIWNNVSGDVLTLTQRRAFRRYIERGGGFVGIHGSAGDPAYDWKWYVDRLVGAQFTGHPLAPQFQDARIRVDDRDNAITAGLGTDFIMNDEWYSFAASPRIRDSRVLLTLDERSYKPLQMGQDISMGSDHPIAWTRCVGSGRSFYSGIGHRPETYGEAHHVTLLEQGIRWAAGRGATRCKAGHEEPPVGVGP